MTWFKIDDKSAFHRKVLRVGNEAWGAFCRAGAVSSSEGTDGRFTADTAAAIAPAKVWAKLIDAGLVDRIDGSTDLQIHDFLVYNPSASQVQAKRQARAIAGAIGGKRSGEARSNSEANGEAIASVVRSNCLPVASYISEPPSRPVPTQPEKREDVERATSGSDSSPIEAPAPATPSPGQRDEAGPGIDPQQAQATPPADQAQKAQEGPSPAEEPATPKPPKAARATRCPSSVDPKAGEWCRERGIPEPRGEVAKMLDHFAAQGGSKGAKADWGATWRNWERRAAEYAGTSNAPRRNTAQTNLQPFVADEEQPYGF